MISASELRMGNWLTLDGQYIQVIDVMCDCINTKDEQGLPYDMVDPIILTPEILEKCGFTKTPAIKGCFNWYHKSGCFGLAYNKLQGLIYCSPFLDLPVVSLHKLQNIFRTNTDTELQITL